MRLHMLGLAKEIPYPAAKYREGLFFREMFAFQQKINQRAELLR